MQETLVSAQQQAASCHIFCSHHSKRQFFKWIWRRGSNHRGACLKIEKGNVEKSTTNSNWSPQRHWVVLAFVPETEVFWVAGWWRGHGGKRESFLVCENTHTHRHTHNIFLLTCFHCLRLRAFVNGYIWFSFNLCCPPGASVHIPLLFSWVSFQASLLTVPPRAPASLSSLSLLALFLFTSPAFPAFSLILSLHFSFIVFSPLLFVPVILPLSLFLTFSSPWIKPAL